jgi:hypothetical protein
MVVLTARVPCGTQPGNLVLLCAHHHRAIHHGGWAVRIGPDGRPVFTPPRLVDADQHPRPAWQPPTLSPTPLRR